MGGDDGDANYIANACKANAALHQKRSFFTVGEEVRFGRTSGVRAATLPATTDTANQTHRNPQLPNKQTPGRLPTLKNKTPLMALYLHLVPRTT